MPGPDQELITSIAAHAAREAISQSRLANQKEMSDIALAAAKEAVRETHTELFALLGINIADFKDMQQFRGDLDFLRTWHKKSDQVGARVTVTIVSALVGAFLLALWIGITNLANVPRVR